jgi:hypothetical protein
MLDEQLDDRRSARARPHRCRRPGQRGEGDLGDRRQRHHIENIEFSGARVPDQKGAGIRQEGANLLLDHCYFHDNQERILGADNPSRSIVTRRVGVNPGSVNGFSLVPRFQCVPVAGHAKRTDGGTIAGAFGS